MTGDNCKRCINDLCRLPISGQEYDPKGILSSKCLIYHVSKCAGETRHHFRHNATVYCCIPSCLPFITMVKSKRCHEKYIVYT